MAEERTEGVVENLNVSVKFSGHTITFTLTGTLKITGSPQENDRVRVEIGSGGYYYDYKVRYEDGSYSDTRTGYTSGYVTFDRISIGNCDTKSRPLSGTDVHELYDNIEVLNVRPDEGSSPYFYVNGIYEYSHFVSFVIPRSSRNLGSISVDGFGGSTSGYLTCKTKVTAVATPNNDCNEFLGWYSGSSSSSQLIDSNPTIVVDAASYGDYSTFNALFQARTCTINATVEPPDSGSVYPTSTDLQCTTGTTFYPTPKGDYKFVKWTGDLGESTEKYLQVKGSEVVKPGVECPLNIVAHFSACEVTVTTSAEPERASKETTGDGSYECGATEIMIGQKPKCSPWEFTHWKITRNEECFTVESSEVNLAEFIGESTSAAITFDCVACYSHKNTGSLFYPEDDPSKILTNSSYVPLYNGDEVVASGC